MCNRAYNKTAGEPENLFTRYGVDWAEPRPMDNRFNPVELAREGGPT